MTLPSQLRPARSDITTLQSETYTQDDELKQSYSSYPELIGVGATYKLIDLVCIMLVEDENVQSEIVAAFMVLQETE